MKNKELEVLPVARQEYSTSISEEYEYSQEKAERVSLPSKNSRVQFIQNITKQNKNTQTL